MVSRGQLGMTQDIFRHLVYLSQRVVYVGIIYCQLILYHFKAIRPLHLENSQCHMTTQVKFLQAEAPGREQ